MTLRIESIEAILDKVTFGRSCDLCWSWEVRRGGDLAFFLVRATFLRPDRETGQYGRGYGRWFHVPEDASESAIVKTAFVAAKLVVEHELLEAFMYHGVRIFDPHHTVQDLARAAEGAR